MEILEAFWPEHPPVFRIGAPVQRANDLSFDGDEGSWIEVIHSGCKQLIELGYASVYLVLDDHPPIGPCRAEHLNSTLPKMLEELKAVYISLVGWDGMTCLSTEPLPKRFQGLRRLGPGFQYHFQLHPALWNLECLMGLSQFLLEHSYRSAWDFERAVRTHFTELPKAWQQAGYRIRGRAMALAPRSGLKHRIQLQFWRLIDRAIRKFSPIDALAGKAICSKSWPFKIANKLISQTLNLVLFYKLGLPRTQFKKLSSKEKIQTFAVRVFSISPKSAEAMGGSDIKRELRKRIGFDRCLYEGPYPVFRNGFLVRGKPNAYFIEHLQRSGQPAYAQKLQSSLLGFEV